MEFNDLQEAIEYAQEHNQDVQRQGDKWVTIDKVVIPKEQVIADLERAIEECEDEEIKAEMQAELDRLKGEE